MLDVPGLQLDAQDRDMLARPSVGGVILGLYSRNYASINQLQDLTSAIRQCNPNLLIAVDQEGGRVQRFRQDFTPLPPMHYFGKLYQTNVAESLSLTETCGWLMAAEVLSCGLDLSFAPVMDLYMESSRIIADRAFAADPEVVATLASAFIKGMHRAGMKATGKHFPGHGSVDADSHVELPVDSRDLEQLLQKDMAPFVTCAGVLDALMPGHVVYTAVDVNCAAMSRIWLQDILRKRLGFHGVIFSDDLGMAAASTAGDALKRAECALAAGCDMILVCNNRQDALATADWLEAVDYPLSKKLVAMQGQGKLSRDDLLASDVWRQANKQIQILEQ
ncbi:MAG: beta-N-acetylhexosaminidase [Gammaproteobacteria bacterium]|nr:beta-N-acetylhexosaminidase [Gammaproteobacteria bacterium]